MGAARRVALASVLHLALLSAAHAATITVNSASDAVNASDGLCTLREAIVAANANAASGGVAGECVAGQPAPTVDLIAFAIPGAGVHTIAPAPALPALTAFPAVTEPVTINGYTQSGATPNTLIAGSNALLRIAIDGSNVGNVGSLFFFEAGSSGSQVRGLVVHQVGTALAFHVGGAANVTIAGNFIGTNAAGTALVATAANVLVFSQNADGTMIGGLAPADRNVIVGSTAAQVAVGGGTGVMVLGNLIGTDASGTIALNPGTASIGVRLFAAQGTQIGAAQAGAGNVIAGQGRGIFAESGLGNLIQGNLIGTDATGLKPIPNASHGIDVSSGLGQVGGTAAGEGNVIAFNGGAGVRVDAAGNKWRIVGNRMVANAKGIDLSDGPLPLANDVLDADAGGNERQNFPLIDSVTLTPTSVRVQGRVVGAASRTLLLDFYASLPPVLPTQFLQGESYLGPAPAPVVTDALGQAMFDVTLAVAGSANLWVTATLTDVTDCVVAACGNTSEFSQRGVFVVLPRFGGAASALPISITGQLFQPGASLAFGATPANGVGVVDAQTLSGFLPLLQPGTLYDVTVTNPDATTATMPKAFVTDFLDIAPGSDFYAVVMNIATAGITTGCVAGQYCGGNEVSRAAMALFLLRGLYGPFFTPPAATGVFADVPVGAFAADWIEQFYAEGITSGCDTNPLRFCPQAAVSRAAMAVFLLKSKHGSGYTPPACTGLFADVSCAVPKHPFADWIEQLAREGITSGCAVDPLRFCPDASVLRLQMAAFLSRVFGLAQGGNAAPAVYAGADRTITLPALASLAGNSADDGLPNPPGALTFAWSKQSGPGSVSFATPADVATTASFGVDGVYVLRLTVSDGELSAHDDVQVTVNPEPVLPPNPQAVASPPQPGVVGDIGEDTRFLYTGATPIQTGVVPGAIDRLRAAVVRGRVLDRGGAAIGGVVVAVLGRPEFGQTLSRADGRFDLAVNGGAAVTLNFTRSGLLPLQRQVSVPVRDYRVLDDVVMIAVESRVTTIVANAGAMQVHQSDVAGDADGSRTSTLLVPAGTTATLVMPDGSTQPLAAINVRATEYTVGASGPRAMPAPLPPTSGYTYAAELSADEVIAAGAAGVVFNQPLFNYVDNFLGFPVGMAVPAAYYDHAKAAWIPMPNGRVVKIVGNAGGAATVDTVGTGSLPPLVLSTEELQKLAQLFVVGQEFWRVPMTHFTPSDYNWPYGPPLDATPPEVPAPKSDDSTDNATCSEGSIVECENQVLGEAVRIAGTRHALHYRSARMPGHTASRALRIALSGASVPASLKGIVLDVQVAGQRVEQSFGAGTNLQTTFTWDGKDVYGRPVSGRPPITIDIGYVYDAIYRSPAEFAASFGLPGNTLLVQNPARGEVELGRSFQAALGTLDARTLGLAGWSLSPHHIYDPQDGQLYLGDGRRRGGVGSIGAIIRRVKFENPVGTPVPNFGIVGIAVGPDGSVFMAGPAAPGGNPVKRLLPNGETVPFGSVPPANTLYSAAVGPDGSVYVTQEFVNNEQGNRVSRIAPDGTTSTIAGLPNAIGFSGDGGPATLAAFERPLDVAVAPDGSVYIVDNGNDRVRRIGTDGIVTTVAGNGVFCNVPLPGACGDGGPATQAALDQPRSVAVAADGTLYILEFGTRRIRRVGTDGIISTHAGNGNDCLAPEDLPCGDGGPATQATLGIDATLALGPDGAVYVAEQGTNRIRVIGPDGIIRTVAGRGGFDAATFVDGMPARQAQLNLHNTSRADVAVAADGTVYIAAGSAQSTYRVERSLPQLALTDIAVAAESGSELYVFDSRGRHLRTLHTLTGATLVEFAYDAAGRLKDVVEKTGAIDNVLTIQRDAAGQPTAIIAPFGQQTTLDVDANGFLSRIVDPAGGEVQLASTAEGLLTSLTDPRGKTTTFAYDAQGRLVLDTDAAGGSQVLVRTATATGHTVSRTSALSRTTTYDVDTTVGLTRTITNPDGTQAVDEDFADAGLLVRTERDGTVTQTTLAPDPRFELASPLAGASTMTLPGGPVVAFASTLSIATANAADPFGFTSLTTTATLAGRTATTTYTAATRVQQTTTPGGRSIKVTIDALGRPAATELVGLAPTTYGYDTRGRVASMTRGSGIDARTSTFAYDAAGFLQSITDPLGRSMQFGRDAAGRVTSRTLPGGTVTSVSYDNAGNVASVTPPGRPAHAFGYSDRGELISITPPVLAGTGPTAVAYDLDRQPTTIARPDNRSVTRGYDAAGRLATRTFATGGVPTATDVMGYDAAGRLASVAAASGVVTSFGYAGPIPTSQTWSGAIGGSVAATYDAGLRVASETVAGAGAVAFGYDDDDLVVAAGALSLTRDPQHGLVTATTLGLVTTAASYNGFGETESYAASAGVTPLYSVSYARDALGRITGKTETIGGATDTFVYTYDAAGQLAGVEKNGTTVETYGYDGNGNRTSATIGGAPAAAAFDAQDRLTSHGPDTFAYSPAGELSARTSVGGVTTYQYDPAGNLVGVGLPGGTTLSYVVDGLDRRVAKRINGAPSRGYLYSDRRRIVAELDAGGALLSRFVYAGGETPAYLVRGGVAHRLVTDQLGSVRLVVNADTGAVVQRIDYDTFGNVTQDSNPGFQPFGFAGGLYDGDTGLVRFGARDYDARVGRWTAKDPSGFGGGDTNLYRYVRNNPVTFVDRSGRTIEEIDDEIAFLEDALPRLERDLRPSTSIQTDLPSVHLVDRQKLQLYRGYRDRLSQLRTIKRLFGPGAQAFVFALACLGVSERANAEGRTTLQQIDVEGRRDFLETIHFYADPFVEAVVDTVRGILPF